MARNIASIERKLMAHISKKYPEPMSKLLHNPHETPTQKMVERRKNEKKLFQVLNQLPNWGIGRLLVSQDDLYHKEPCFWKITRVSVDHTAPDLDVGVAYGVYTHCGYCEGYEREVDDMNEHLWRLVPKYMESKFTEYKPEEWELKEVPLYVKYPPLLRRMLQAQTAKTSTEEAKKEPMYRMVIKRGPRQKSRQRMDDGTLV